MVLLKKLLPGKPRAAFILAFGLVLGFGPSLAGLHGEPVAKQTVLGIQGTRFTLNGTPTFLLGFSYYGALGAPVKFVRQDLDDFHQRGFNWLRVWATWTAFGDNVSAVTRDGRAREPFLSRLTSLLAECDRRGMVVDITLTRNEGSATEPLPNFAAHRRAVRTLVRALKPFRNWYLDLANEHDVRDRRYVSFTELKRLREEVRQLDPQRLVTASTGGHDLSRKELRAHLVAVGLDFVAPHRPRVPKSPGQTELKTRQLLAWMQAMGHPAPIQYQEPFRRGYTTWQPVAQDFLTDLRGAIAGGAAGWCFHNGSQRGTPDDQPRRSFDMRKKRLLDQLDREERAFIDEAAHRESPRAARP